MGNIINDIVDDIEVKPNKTKKVLKWVVSISVSLIGIAFVLGQFKASFFNRMDTFETKLNEVKTEQTDGFNSVNTRIDKVYDDGVNLFNEFQINNNKQLELIIDYGGTNNDLLKKMLELNTINLESQVEKAKNENPVPVVVKPKEEHQSEIMVQKVDERPATKEYIGMIHFIDVESNDTTFNLTGATKKYIDNINRYRYEVGAIIENDKYPGRYDVAYRNKR